MASLTDFFSPSATSPIPVPEVLFAVVLSFVLTSGIALLYQKTYRGTAYSQDYVHALIIFGTVVTVVMMVVRGDLATAFGIFAAFSIIRFRRNLPHSRDIAFIFFAMVIGMSVGARLYPLAVLATVVVALSVILLSRLDLFAPSRPSHFLRIRLTHDINPDTAFTNCFQKFAERVEMISMETIQAGLMMELRYSVRLNQGAHPGEFLESVRQANGNNRVVLTTVAATNSATD